MSNGKKLKKGLTQYREEKEYAEKDNQVTGMMDPNAEGIPPAKKKQYEDYVDTLMYVLHNEESADSVMDMLAADDPRKSVPNAVLMVQSKVDEGLKKKGVTVPNDTKVAGAGYLVSDLVQMGNASNAWEGQMDDQDTSLLFQDSIQKHIEVGLKDGTLDPVKLQQEVEPLMTEEQRAQGLAYGQELGVAAEPTGGMAVNQIVDRKLSKEREKTDQMKKQMGAVDNIANAATGGGAPAPQEMAGVKPEGGTI